MAVYNREKFFLETGKSSDFTDIMRMSRQLMVSIDLPMEMKQHLDIRISKNGNELDIPFPPKTDEHTIIKLASKEDFYSKYHSTLRSIHQLDKGSGSFYLAKRYGKPANGVVWFSEDDKNKAQLKIEFYDDFKEFSLDVHCTGTWQGIQNFRKAGNTIDAKQFNLFFKIVFNFLHDVENYATNCIDLPKQFIRIIEGERPEMVIAPLVHGDKSIAVEKITTRIHSIEKRLMELDTDVPEERMKMRGELEGLRFALNAIQEY